MWLKSFLLLLYYVPFVQSDLPAVDLDQKSNFSEGVQKNFDLNLDINRTEFAAKSPLVSQLEKRVYPESFSYRLPNSSHPIRYNLWLKTDVDKANFNFSGRVKILIKIVETTQLITLHYRQIAFDKIDLLSSNGDLMDSNLTFTCNEAFEFLIISLPIEKKPNDEIILDIRYNGVLRNDTGGFYRASYVGKANDTVWYATTHFEATNARHAMPCYDEPWIRAPTSLEIQHDKSYEAISNMPIWSKTSIEGTDYVTSKFRNTPPMQTYLLAIVVSNFKHKSSNETKVKQRVYAKPQSIEEGEADFVAKLVGPMLRKFEEHLGVPYPLIKLDHIAITDFKAGAMENFGLVTYKENLMLTESATEAELVEHSTIIHIVAHEIAHQYFGNIVSPFWWSFTWLSEGFATLYEHYIPGLMFPDDGYMDRLSTTRDTCFMTDVNDSKPLNFYVETPKGIEKRFKSISYQKGGSVLRMFQEALTVPTFTKGLKYYLTEMFYKAATPSDLHRNLQKAYDEDFPDNQLDIETVMSTWEDQAGYPIVTVTKSAEKIILNQKRFGGGDEIYAIPISYVSETLPELRIKTPKLWMTTKSLEIPGMTADDWILLNEGGTGYYKVSYDDGVWRTFVDKLKKIPIMIKMKIFEDVSKSADGTRGLDLLSSLKAENESAVWKEAGKIDKHFLMHLFGTSTFSKYQKFIRSIVKPHLDRLGFEKIEGESDGNSILRTVLITLSCRALQPECLEHAHKKYFEHGDTSAMCESMRLVSAENYTDLIEKAKNGGSFTGLGCALEKNLLVNYCSEIVNSTNGLSAAQRSFILGDVYYRSVAAMDVTLDFILVHYTAIYQTIGASLEESLNDIGYFISSDEHANKLEAILELIETAEFMEKPSIASIREDLQSKAKWRKENLKLIEAWLDVN